jgi:hypothetical protein
MYNFTESDFQSRFTTCPSSVTLFNLQNLIGSRRDFKESDNLVRRFQDQIGCSRDYTEHDNLQQSLQNEISCSRDKTYSDNLEQIFQKKD